MSTPHKCSICLGTGKVAAQYYDSDKTRTLTSSDETCRTCCGIGIVWEPGIELSGTETQIDFGNIDELESVVERQDERKEEEKTNLVFDDGEPKDGRPTFYVKYGGIHVASIEYSGGLEGFHAFFVHSNYYWSSYCLNEVSAFLLQLKG